MRKLLTFMAMYLALFMSANAQFVSISSIGQSNTDTTVLLSASIMCNDTSFYDLLRDTSADFTNPVSSVMPVFISPGLTTWTFTDDSLTPGQKYYYKLFVANKFDLSIRDSADFIVQTSAKAEIGNLLGVAMSTDSVRLTCDFKSHGWSTTIKYIRISDGVVVKISGGLMASGLDSIGTDTVTVAQAMATTELYLAVGWNVSHSNPADYDSIVCWFPITTPGILAQAPSVDSLSASNVTSSGLDTYFGWRSDSLNAVVYVYSSCDAFATAGNIVSVFAVPSGSGDTSLHINHLCGGNANVSVMIIIENAYGSFYRDTLIKTFATPQAPSGSLIPFVLWRDTLSFTTEIAVDSITVASPSAFIQIEFIDSDTAMNGAVSITIPIIGPVVNATASYVFQGYPGECYRFRSALFDGATITQSWYFQSEELCFPNIVTEISDGGLVDVGDQTKDDNKLGPDDFPTNISVTNILGQTIGNEYCNSWTEMCQKISDAGISNQMLFLSSYEYKTGITKTRKIIPSK